jgi:hypothetical protein
LKRKRDLATDPKKIQAFTKDINALQSQVSGLTSGKTGTGLGASVLQGLGFGGGAALVSGGISLIQDFISDSSRLAAETEGVERAFKRLNRPDLLNELQKATKGTVSNLELMKNAVQFSNFGLPIDKLGIALEFARRRAKDTGVEVDYLVQSIVTGIGRQSPLILDNLGINAKRVAAEFQRTGNFAEAAFKIIQEESAKAGADLETFAEKQARLNATIENSQANFGKGLNDAKGLFLSFLSDLTDSPLLTSGKFFSDGFFTKQYLDAKQQIKEGNVSLEAEQRRAQSIFQLNFSQYAREYQNADFDSRKQIVEQSLLVLVGLQRNNSQHYRNKSTMQELV